MAGWLLGLQRTAGHRAVNSLLQLQTTPEKAAKEPEAAQAAETDASVRRRANEIADTNPDEAAAMIKEIKADLEDDKNGPIAPWLKAIDDKQATLLAEAKEAGVDFTQPPVDSRHASKRLQAAQKAVASVLKKGHAGKFRDRDKAAVDALAEALDVEPPAEPLTIEAVSALSDTAKERLAGMKTADTNEKKFKKKRELYEFGPEMREKLVTDLKYLFGVRSKKHGKLSEDANVDKPSPTQLVNLGYYRFMDPAHPQPGDDPSLMISKMFVKEMVLQGVDPAAAWDSPDSMHFELPMGWGGHD